MEFLQLVVDFANQYIIEIGPSVGGERIAVMVILLLGTGLYLTVRTGFIQVRQLGHGIAVTSGKYDDPDDPGDVSHFQALTTALSATVGIGNIAGVAMAIHWGGPGALFWMWVTAFLGMATKYAEVTLAQKYRITDEVGNVAGGPMYYIERGLGPKWKPMAIFFAVMLAFTAFFTGNAVQANTVADQMSTTFTFITPGIMGAITALIVCARTLFVPMASNPNPKKIMRVELFSIAAPAVALALFPYVNTVLAIEESIIANRSREVWLFAPPDPEVVSKRPSPISPLTPKTIGSTSFCAKDTPN